MSEKFIIIGNIPDDLERKVISFSFLNNDPIYDYVKIANEGLPDFHAMVDKTGFSVLDIDGDTKIDINRPKTDAGNPVELQLNYTVKKQNESDIDAIEWNVSSKGVLAIFTSTHIYLFGNYEEPMTYTYREDNGTISVSCSGTQRRPVLRKKYSPFKPL